LHREFQKRPPVNNLGKLQRGAASIAWARFSNELFSGTLAMTILGMHLSPGGRSALMWCDTEYYQDEVAAGHVQKMAINVLLGVVIVGAGSAYTNKIAAERLQQAFNLEDLLSELSAELRHYRGSDYPSRHKTGATLAIAGWSHKHGRIVGFVMSGSTDYSPAPASSFSLPVITDFSSLHPENVEDVVGTAHAQMREVRKIYPSAGAGMLTVAEIGPDAITVRPLYDLGRGEFLRAPLAFQVRGVA
jgi:hypothetical protein